MKPRTESPVLKLVRKGLDKLKERLHTHRIGLALWMVSTVLSFFVGVWLTGVIDCLPRAQESVRRAVEGAGYLGQGEDCFFLPPVDSGGNQNELRLAEGAIADAEQALADCRLRCVIGDCCQGLRRDITLARANLALLSGRCEEALTGLEPARKSSQLSNEEAITWAWAKVETSPDADGLRQAISVLGETKNDACVATTRGAFLRRLAALQDGEREREGLLRRALAEQDRAVSLSPRSVLVSYNRAIVFFDLGEVDKAQAALDTAGDYLAGRTDPYWHQAQAQVHYLHGEPNEALANLDAAVETGYPDPGFRLSRGWVLLKERRPRDARRDFERAREMIARQETSCRRLPDDDLLAEVEWGLARARWKETGAGTVDIEALRNILTPGLEHGLRQEIEADLTAIVAELQAKAGSKNSKTSTH